MTSPLHISGLEQQLHNDHLLNLDRQSVPFTYLNKYLFDCAVPTRPLLSDFYFAAALLDQHNRQQDDSMHPDSWGPAAQLSLQLGRPPHQRDHSPSSLASSGPLSPFSQQFSNPRISTNDPSGDVMMDMHSNNINLSTGGSYYQLAKPLESYQNYQNLDTAAVTEMAYPYTIPGPEPHQRQRLDRGLLPAPDFSGGSSRSHPASVASSIADDSPATPTVPEVDSADTRRRQGFNAPKFDRTMTDVYGDELYSPNFTITSSSPAQPPNVAAMPNNNVFNQRISAANTQHLHTSHHSPSMASREISPFRNGSPLAPTAQEWKQQENAALNPAQRMRDRNRARHGARVVPPQHQRQRQQQHFHPSHHHPPPPPPPPHPHQHQPGQQDISMGTPQTISPKDAMLEFNDADEDAQFPLFPPATTDFGADHLTSALNGASNLADGSHVEYTPPQVATATQISQGFSSIAQSRATQGPSMHRTSPKDSTSIRVGDQTSMHGRPVSVGAEGGTYTCTYHGCTLRFETPSLLQKHKREGHRQTHSLGGMRHPDVAVAAGLANSQAGPHRCDRINPSTGKPCNTVFSRPYDLTRHEDTIHNARKKKVHCNICTEDKTFSRADALTRHYRVCHPDMELPGKHRRRGGS